jgi:hypothetical protein
VKSTKYTRSSGKNKLPTFLSYNTDYTANDVSNNSSIVAHVHVATVTFLLSRCLAIIGGYTYRHTDVWEGFMKNAVEMAQNHDIHTKFHKDWFRHSKVD